MGGQVGPFAGDAFALQDDIGLYSRPIGLLNGVLQAFSTVVSVALALVLAVSAEVPILYVAVFVGIVLMPLDGAAVYRLRAWDALSIARNRSTSIGSRGLNEREPN